MEKNEIIAKLNSEAWQHTPDLCQKIVESAQLSGKLKPSAPSGSGASGLSGGGTAAGVKIGAIVLSAMVAAGAGIGIPVALSNNGGPDSTEGVNPPSASTGQLPEETPAPPEETPVTPEETPVTPAPHEHVYGVWKVVLPASCTVGGKKERSCDCGDKQTEAIPAAHAFAAAALYDDNSHWHECSVCGETDTAEEHEYAPSGECTECENKIEITEGLSFALNEDGQSYMVTTGPVGIINLVIPAEYNGYPVTKVNSQAFCYRNELETVAIPSTVTYIDRLAFAGNYNLTSVTIYRSTQQTFNARAAANGAVIVAEAFSGCNKIEKVDLPQGLTSIGAYAFNACNSLKSIDIPDSVSEIGERAFCGARSLTSIKLPQSLKTLSYCMFEGCEGLEEVILNDGLETIEGTLFGGCPIKYLHIPSSVIKIEEAAFSGIDRNKIIEVTVDAPNYKIEDNCLIEIDSGTLMFAFNNPVIPTDGSIKKIAAFAFDRNKTISSIVIPNGVTEIGMGAFESSTLTSIVIPEGVTALYMSVFDRCEQLTTVRLPSTVTSFAYLAFCRCYVLSTVYYNGTISQFNAITKESGWKSSPPSRPVRFTLVATNGNTTIS